MGIVAQLYTAEVLKRERERGKDVALYRGCRGDNRRSADGHPRNGERLTSGDYLLFGIALGIMIVYGVLQLL
ncbi:MAG: hypothetical protein A3K30_03175 [Deltaproteobacteria bacterium RBG_13_51_10]|nr:MAG: hypothetical protein A3K30_03175 [Deltaproteobacteria bacterium RBG_13_51_10]